MVFAKRKYHEYGIRFQFNYVYYQSPLKAGGFMQQLDQELIKGLPFVPQEVKIAIFELINSYAPKCQEKPRLTLVVSNIRDRG